MDYEIKKSDDEWRVELNEEQFAVLRGAATERAWTGELLDEDRSPLPETADLDRISAWAIAAQRRHWNWV